MSAGVTAEPRRHRSTITTRFGFGFGSVGIRAPSLRWLSVWPLGPKVQAPHRLGGAADPGPLSRSFLTTPPHQGQAFCPVALRNVLDHSSAESCQEAFAPVGALREGLLPSRRTLHGSAAPSSLHAQILHADREDDQVTTRWPLHVGDDQIRTRSITSSKPH